MAEVYIAPDPPRKAISDIFILRLVNIYLQPPVPSVGTGNTSSRCSSAPNTRAHYHSTHIFLLFNVYLIITCQHSSQPRRPTCLHCAREQSRTRFKSGLESFQKIRMSFLWILQNEAPLLSMRFATRSLEVEARVWLQSCFLE